MLSRTCPLFNSSKAEEIDASRDGIWLTSNAISKKINAVTLKRRVFGRCAAVNTQTSKQSPSNRSPARDALAFSHRYNLVRFDVLQYVDSAAGPAKLEPIRACSLLHAEVNSQIVLR